MVVIAHSYGSMPASEALRGVDRKKATLLIVAGFLFDVGTTIISGNGGTNPPSCGVVGDIVQANDPVYFFYHDIPKADQGKSVEDLKFMPFVYVSCFLPQQSCNCCSILTQ